MSKDLHRPRTSRLAEFRPARKSPSPRPRCPAWMAVREGNGTEAAAEGPLASPASLHMTIQTGRADRDAPKRLAADIRWVSCNIYSTQDPRGRRHSRPAAIPVFAIKGESLTDYWDYTRKLFEWG